MRPALVLVALLAGVQDKKLPKVDPVRVDQAIKRGVEYLKGQIGRYGSLNTRRSEELILWTFVHAGVPEGDPKFQELLKTVLETKLEWTYCVSLQAMILEEMDRVKYQGRIQQCAQFLVDNQCKNGQWSYGSPSLFVDQVPTTAPRRDVASSGGKAREVDPSVPLTDRKKPRVTRKVTVRKMKDGPDVGDNSNSQYAALGLRSCHDAGVILPKDVVELADRWWREAKGEPEKSDGYGAAGWSYGKKGGGPPYGSMTAGAVGGLLIYDYIRNRAWKNDPDVAGGLQWMARNFTVAANPGNEGEAGQGGWHHYYLYAMERAGIYYGTEKLGGHEWYVEGATLLLGAQNGDGAWQSKGADHAIWDTCFAILFLRRATRPLEDVATTDRTRK